MASRGVFDIKGKGLIMEVNWAIKNSLVDWSMCWDLD